MNIFPSLFSFPSNEVGTGMPPGMIALMISALVILLLIIVVIESAVLQLLAWDSFRQCLRAAFSMNVASSLVGFFFLALIPRFALLGLLFACVLSIFIEGLVLSHRKPGENRRNWIAAVVANLASYLLLIFPIYYYSSKSV